MVIKKQQYYSLSELKMCLGMNAKMIDNTIHFKKYICSVSPLDILYYYENPPAYIICEIPAYDKLKKRLCNKNIFKLLSE